jgi:hypothetical protein
MCDVPEPLLDGKDEFGFSVGVGWADTEDWFCSGVGGAADEDIS